MGDSRRNEFKRGGGGGSQGRGRSLRGQNKGDRSRRLANIGRLNANNLSPEELFEGDRVNGQASLDDLTDSVFSNAV
ncbi:hypothetical protein AAHA92_30905 [Salvia divinorum]|uniref:Uncharacterized protein n=1 Tax=Salvia divinorum TaxID=28513 RepID=A0ABD1FSY7_SALDI